MARQSKANPAAPPKTGSIAPARAAAFAILTRIATTAAHSDDLLHGPAVQALSPEDRNLTTALVLGVLRWQLALDARIRPLLQRPDAELHPAALLALRLGIFQLEYLARIPAHAAINESVELARANGAPHAAGMVNALLRRMTRDSEANGPVRQTLAAASPAETAHPQWLMQRWRARYGGKAARLMAGYDQAEPPQHGLFGGQPDKPQSDSADPELRTDSRIADLPRIDDGSRLVAEIAASAVPHARRILDACAAPGGKTLVLAHRHAEAEIVAADVNERRLTAMRKRLDADPVGSRVTTVLADMAARHLPARTEKRDGPEASSVAGGASEVGVAGTADDTGTADDIGTAGVASAAGVAGTLDALQGSFDLILCDVPCSGTGTLARNPEIRHRLREGDLPRQAERQLALLRNSVRRLAPEGRLIYSTCSLEPEENEAVVAALVAEGTARIVPIAPVLERLPALQQEARLSLLASAVTAEGTLRTLPGVHACDGFYAAVLARS